MFFTVHKITNQTNNKCYVGVHQTANTEDGYMGSGTYLKRAYQKHGIENFTKEILFIFDNQDEMFAKEAEIVNKDFVSWSNTYNIKVGGYGGWDYINRNGINMSENWKEASAANLAKGSQAFVEFIQDDTNKANWKRSVSDGMKKYVEKNGAIWTGKTHTEETKRKLSDRKKGKGTGQTNSQFGTCWIHDETTLVPKKVSKSELDFWLSNGYSVGRILK